MDASKKTAFRCGRGEMKYEVFQIIESQKTFIELDKLDPKSKELALSLMKDIEGKIQKL